MMNAWTTVSFTSLVKQSGAVDIYLRESVEYMSCAGPRALQDANITLSMIRLLTEPNGLSQYERSGDRWRCMTTNFAENAESLIFKSTEYIF